MKITLLGHRDLASLYALNRLIGLLPEHRYTVFFSADGLPRDDAPDMLVRAARQEREWVDQYLAAGVAPELIAGRALDAPNSAAGLALLNAAGPDLVVSIRYRRILHEAAIATPRIGTLNLHSGILPDYRGVMATFWAMLYGEKEIGCSTHFIVDAGIDTGPVVSIARRPVDYEKSYLANVLGLYEPGCQHLADAMSAIASRNAPRQIETGGGGRYFSSPDVADITAFQRQGLKLIDGSELQLCF